MGKRKIEARADKESSKIYRDQSLCDTERKRFRFD